MIETEFKKINVITTGRLCDDEVCLRIEDTDSCTGITNLCWLKENEVKKLIGYLTEAEKRLEEKRKRLMEVISNTDFSNLYNTFEHKYNEYPVQMSRSEAFGHALHDGLIDQDTYDAAQICYGRLWNYVGD